VIESLDDFEPVHIRFNDYDEKEPMDQGKTEASESYDGGMGFLDKVVGNVEQTEAQRRELIFYLL
jgi:hypothetical protein